MRSGADDRTDHTPTVVPRWGRRIVRESVGDRRCLVFADRHRHLGDVCAELGQWGERTALSQGGRHVSYRELTVASNAEAARLRCGGVGPGSRIFLLAPASIDWVVTFWAVMRTGATVIIGNGWWSRTELEHAVSRTEPTIAIADSAGASLLPKELSVLPMHSGPEHDAVGPILNEPVDEDATAVILFTSGTTSAPRAAELSHRALIAGLHTRFLIRGRMPDEEDRTRHPTGQPRLISTPLFHVGGLTDLMFTLASGQRVVLLSGRFDAREVLELIESERVTSWAAVPTMASRVLDEPSLAVRDTSSLRHIGLGGAPVPPTLRTRLAAAFPRLRSNLGVVWGLSESGGTVTLGTEDDLRGRPGCVGRPLPTFEVRIGAADASGEGELLVHSPTLMTGYRCESDSPIDSDGWLHTGDLGRIDDNGYVYLTGRAKDVIIRAGENIAAAHVEAWLSAQSEIAHAAVVGLPHADLGEEVAAAVVLRAGVGVSVSDLVRRARTSLASYAIPSRWWVLDGPLPLNHVGKVDKRALVSAWLAQAERGREERGRREWG